MQNSKEEIDFKIIGINPEPIGIYAFPRENHLRYKKCFQLIYKNAAEELRQNFPSEIYTEHICNNWKQNIFSDFSDYEEIKELKDYLNFFLLDFIKRLDFLCEEVVFTDAWLNNANRKAILGNHHHANSYISGNYFINFNKESHSMLTYANDRKGLARLPTMSIPEDTENRTLYTTDNVAVPADEGNVLFWRSHLSHGYQTPNQEDNRLTLSFNTMPKLCTEGAQRYSFEVST